MKRRFYTTQDYLACELGDSSDWAIYDRTLGESAMPIAVFASRTHARVWCNQMNDAHAAPGLRGK